MPKIGMSSSAMIMADWLDALKVAAQNEFDAFEITCVFPSADPQDIKPEALADARKILQQNPMEICVHAPFFEINIAAYCKSIQEESIRIIETSIDLCQALNGKTLIMHNGNYTYSIPGATRHNHPALEIQWVSDIAALRQIDAPAFSLHGSAFATSARNNTSRTASLRAAEGVSRACPERARDWQ